MSCVSPLFVDGAQVGWEVELQADTFSCPSPGRVVFTRQGDEVCLEIFHGAPSEENEDAASIIIVPAVDMLGYLRRVVAMLELDLQDDRDDGYYKEIHEHYMATKSSESEET